ncbi:MAG: 16S rRNA (cytidine(1402)-2'-O)-methyltransferase [Candidatus Aegiribacteria sp.]|nr:16S rRNA (cytidine(1402)-2'-O)-methyltransferase [Candidatus Aegiribacteria sp.]MBD3295490.1 16S rRNA (cytidine(1402)-2'-O)-methyltransferase [Candidatus Fermentibacteria bacterium]
MKDPMTDPEPSSGGSSGTLILVGTPIGNLSDMSQRAQEVIGDAEVVMAEDTRRTSKFVVDKRCLFSYHDHNASGRIPQIVDFLKSGTDVVLVSDAGMPGISDPAFRAVRASIESGFRVKVVPGPTALVCAVAASGLPVDRFAFEGFLPRKKGRRRKKLMEMSSYTGSLVYYVGPHHLVKYLSEMKQSLGNRPVCVCREITKLHEEFLRGSIVEILDHFDRCKVRGEITLVVGGAGQPEDYYD